jgi:serine/threonine protein kinase
MTDKTQAVIVDKRYKLHEALGQGGMGAVYRAEDLLTGHPVALKQVTIPTSQLTFASRSNDSDLTLALAQEFRALATIRHPHIISVYDFGFDRQQQPYFTMEYINGGKTILSAGQTGSLEEKVNLIIQMLQALVYLHRRGILHRDLKPANALVLDGRLKVLDLGLSVITGRTMKYRTQTTSGTMAYMAPELFQGAAYSRASDLYAVGIMAFELFSGHYPYNESNLATMLNDILNKQVEASSYGITGELAGVLDRLLAKEPGERYDSAADALVDLCKATKVPLPPETEQIRESFLQAAKFVGRGVEMARLSGLLKAAIGGEGATLLIGGESGVGKSRLLDELRTQALVEGFLVLRGQAISNGRAGPAGTEATDGIGASTNGKSQF